MSVSDFIITQTTSNMSTRLSGCKTIARLENINSNDRYTFGVDGAGLAETINHALCEIDGESIAYAYDTTGLSVVLDNDHEDLATIAERLSVYDILRKYSGDAAVKPVKNRTVSKSDGARAQIIGEYWQTDTRGHSHLRGIQVAFWYDGYESDMETFDFACNKNSRISQKSYGIGALWELAKPEIEANAKEFAMECRTRTHMYTRTRYALEKLVEGIAVRK